MEITLIAIDLAKNVFHLWAVNSHGKNAWKKRVSRGQLLTEMAKLPRVTVAMEACGGAHYWGRQFGKLGFTVKLIPPQYVKPFVKTNKTDMADAEAISEAAVRPAMRFTEVRGIDQQELQHLHRARELAIKRLVALRNALHGTMLEHGIALPKGKAGMRMLPEKLANCELTSFGIELIEHELKLYWEAEEQVTWYDQKIHSIAKAHPVCRRLLTIPGVGPITATALVAKTSSPSGYKNGRAFSASLGLVPKQHSTGGKQRLLGISKRGDSYLRQLLVHGARSLLYRAERKNDPTSVWVTNLKNRRGWNKTCVALANKTARICWSVLRFERVRTNESSGVNTATSPSR